MCHLRNLTIILPTLNEAKNVPLLIRKILQIRKNLHIIVSDDGSKDRTKKAVLSLSSKQVLFLDRKNKKIHGLTASVIDAILHTKTPYFIVMDADFQHPVKTINELLAYLEAGADMAVACRAEKVKEALPPHRELFSQGAHLLASARLTLAGKSTPPDLMSGFFGMRTSLAKALILRHSFQLEGYKIMFELLKHMPSDAEIACVPYKFSPRGRGASKFNARHMLYFLRSLA